MCKGQNDSRSVKLFKYHAWEIRRGLRHFYESVNDGFAIILTLTKSS